MAPRRRQDGPKTPKSRFQDALKNHLILAYRPRRPQDAPRPPQDAPKTPPSGPKTPSWRHLEATRRPFRPVKTGIFCIFSLSRVQDEIKTRKRNMQNIPVFTARQVLGWSSRRRLGAIWKPPEATRRPFRLVKTCIFCILSLSRLQNEIKTRKRNMQNIPVFTSRNGPRVVAKAGQDGAKTTPKQRQVAKRPQDVQERRRKRDRFNLFAAFAKETAVSISFFHHLFDAEQKSRETKERERGNEHEQREHEQREHERNERKKRTARTRPTSTRPSSGHCLWRQRLLKPSWG